MPVRIARSLGVLLLMLPLIFAGILSVPVMAAADLELQGNELGLEVIPAGSSFFDLQGLMPGDQQSGTLTIRNSYRDPFDLFMKAEKNGIFESVDLFNQLRLKITFRGSVLFDGYMKDFATANTAIGRFQPNEVQVLNAVVSLPGPETGNEYQGKSTEVNWIFTAQSTTVVNPPDDDEREPRDEPTPTEIATEESIPQALPETPSIVEEEVPEGFANLPKTGEFPDDLLLLLGAISMLSGVIILIKTRRLD